MKNFTLLFTLLLAANSAVAQIQTVNDTLAMRTTLHEGEPITLPKSPKPATENLNDNEGEVSGNYFPRPFLFLGPSLMDGGYAALAWVGEAGLNIEGKYLIFSGDGAYDSGHKVNDNDQPN